MKENMLCGVHISSDKLRYSVYEDGRIYLLNTDYDLPITVIIREGAMEKRLTLEPLELKILKNQQT